MRHETIPAAVDQLMTARALIAKGWVKHNLRVERPACVGGDAYCVLGALTAAQAGYEGHTYLLQALPYGFSSFVSFNDSRCTEQADVLALFDRAIALALVS